MKGKRLNQIEEISGTVDRLIYQNIENGFTVFVLQSKKNISITVCGYMPNIKPGEQVLLEGGWCFHSKFGKQFEARKCQSLIPTSIVGLKKYLGSGLIKGIGKVYAEKLVNYFGSEILEIIDKEPEKMQQIDGIGKKRILKIKEAWKDQKEISKVMIFLQDKGISPIFATKIYKKYGQESIKVLEKNPYTLADDIWGIGFKTADKIAQTLGFDKKSIQRIQSGILFTISNTANNGHLYIELSNLKENIIKILELDPIEDQEIIKTSLHKLYNNNRIKLLTFQGKHFITTPQFYHTEKGIASKLIKLLTYPSPYKFNLNEIYKKIKAPANKNDLLLNEKQQKAIITALQNKITIITGGPGTGKTTLIKKLLKILDQNNINFKLAAPTGRAAKRIIEGAGRNAITIHRMLEFDFNTMNFIHNEQNALKLDFLIIDESSMIDVFLANAIIKALPLYAHLILIGDINQLPSVGAGNFLKDLINSKKIPCISLSEIFRQAEDSLIVLNAHRINNGEFPKSFLQNSKKDFYFIKEDQVENILEHLNNIFLKTIKRKGIPLENSIVLTPMNKGISGSHNLNRALQDILNPIQTDKQINYSGSTFKIGDRIMQIRNNYDKKVFNGDIGIIKDISTEDRKLIIEYPEKEVEYEFGELDELTLSYAISIHKSQGSEYDAVVIPIFMQHFTLLQRNLIYTAVTRAKKLCILIGQIKAIAIGIKNNKDIKRQTFLKEFLTTDLECR